MRELSELEGELSAGEWQPREKRQGHPGAAGITVGFSAQVLGRSDFPGRQLQVRLHSVAVMEWSRARCGMVMYERRGAANVNWQGGSCL